MLHHFMIFTSRYRNASKVSAFRYPYKNNYVPIMSVKKLFV